MLISMFMIINFSRNSDFCDFDHETLKEFKF